MNFEYKSKDEIVLLLSERSILGETLLILGLK